MTLDERIEALTMNLELTARDVADLQKATADMHRANADLQKNTTEFQLATAARFAQWEMEKKHLDEKVDALTESTQMLLSAVQAQQGRIERVERRLS
jgi:hypothetical protein